MSFKDRSLAVAARSGNAFLSRDREGAVEGNT